MCKKIYDVVGIGIGPFNLGLAALCHTIPELTCLFIDKRKEFNWHPGLMIPGTRLQVPFYADLVTLADPCNPFNYMSFLKAKRRLFRFGISENYFITRREYNQYCQWVAGQLTSLNFNRECMAIIYNEKDKTFSIVTDSGKIYTKHIVVGTGTVPNIPKLAEKLISKSCFHSSEYVFRKKSLLWKDKITIVGSGQSAAEIFMDLLDSRELFPGGIDWFTRSERYFPMDNSPFSFEMSTPDYIDHFYGLQDAQKSKVLSNQNELYKGINASLISNIYDKLYEQYIEGFKNPVRLHPNCELLQIQKSGGELQLRFQHIELKQNFDHHSAAVILATGYQTKIPAFIDSLKNLINRDKNNLYEVNRNYSVDNKNRVFVQNAETHCHGFNAADLSLGPYRNAVILNSILGRPIFKNEVGITFQDFGLPV